MKLNRGVMTVLAASLAWTMPAQSQSGTPAPENGKVDVDQLFATTCGWCRSDGGRAAGKGPQLMDTKRDDFVRDRIKNGKSARCRRSVRCSATRRSTRSSSTSGN